MGDALSWTRDRVMDNKWRGKKASVTCRQKKEEGHLDGLTDAPTSGEVFVLTDRSVVNDLHNNNNEDALRAMTERAVALLRLGRARSAAPSPPHRNQAALCPPAFADVHFPTDILNL